MSIGQRIKEVRTQLGITQAQLARRIGTTTQNISQYERNIRNPKFATLQKIASALGCDVTIFLPSQNENPEYFDSVKEQLTAEQREEMNSIAKGEIEFESDQVQKGKLDLLYMQLNNLGRQKVVSYAEDLSKLKEYQSEQPKEKLIFHADK